MRSLSVPDLLAHVERVEDVLPGGVVGKLLDEFVRDVLRSSGHGGCLLDAGIVALIALRRTASIVGLRT